MSMSIFRNAVKAGRCACTHGVAQAILEHNNGDLDALHEFITSLLERHTSGDWGSIDEHDQQVNIDALQYDNRLMSVYQLPNGDDLWIITDGGWRHAYDNDGQAITTILTPNEY